MRVTKGDGVKYQVLPYIARSLKVPRLPTLVFLFKMIMSVEHHWNDNDRGKPEFSEENSPLCYFIHHTADTTSRIRGSSALRAGDQLPKALKPVVRLNMFQNSFPTSQKTFHLRIRTQSPAAY